MVFRLSSRSLWRYREMGKLENAKSLYLEGIRDGHARAAVEKYTGDRYTQHSTGVADGVEGFVAFFEPFIERNPDRHIELVRGLEDGRYVFVHAYQELNGGEAKWVTMDLFDTDENDRIIEHWDVIAAWSDETVSGHTQIDGPGEIQDLHLTDSNKALVRDFVEVVLKNGDASRITDFVSTETYIQHNPLVGDGLDGLGAFLTELADSGSFMRYEEIVHLVGSGNFVATLSRVNIGGQEMAVFDLFRVQDGLIVEHWDAMEPVPPREEWANSGKF